MLEKVKQFFAGIASATIVLYAVGYISEYAHARMLGITMVDPPTEYYLISGGTFFLSTIINLYNALFSHWYFFVIFALVAGAFVFGDKYAQKSNRLRGQVLLIVVLLIIIYLYMEIVIPALATPLGFRDLLLHNYDTIQGTGIIATLKRELRTEIVEYKYVSKVLPHYAFYGLLWLFTALAGLVTYLAARHCLREKQADTAAVLPLPRHKWIRNILRLLPPVLTVILCIATAILVILIPLDHGILIKPNLYPEVHITTVPGVELMPDLHPDPNAEKYMWLLRENKDELLVHAKYTQKETDKPLYKILVIKKSQVATIEILKHSFILNINRREP